MHEFDCGLYWMFENNDQIHKNTCNRIRIRQWTGGIVILFFFYSNPNKSLVISKFILTFSSIYYWITRTFSPVLLKFFPYCLYRCIHLEKLICRQLIVFKNKWTLLQRFILFYLIGQTSFQLSFVHTNEKSNMFVFIKIHLSNLCNWFPWFLSIRCFFSHVICKFGDLCIDRIVNRNRLKCVESKNTKFETSHFLFLWHFHAVQTTSFIFVKLFNTWNSKELIILSALLKHLLY